MVFNLSLLSWPVAVPLFLALKFFDRCHLGLHLLVGALWGLGFALLLGGDKFVEFLSTAAGGALWALLFWLVVYGERAWPIRAVPKVLGER